MGHLSMLLHLVSTTALAAVVAGGRVRGGPTPPHSQYATFDCKLRQLALDFALELQPDRRRDEVQAIADALNNATYAECRNLTIPAGVLPPAPPAPALPPSGAPGVFFVDYTTGSDDASGSVGAPLKTIAAAIAKIGRGSVGDSPAVVLRGGTHYLAATLELSTAHSGLRLLNYPNEQARASQTRTSLPFFKMAQYLDLSCVLLHAPGGGGNTRLESRTKKYYHLIYG